MSYEIVKSIAIKSGKVMLNSTSNNVRPRDYCLHEIKEWSDLLKTKGKEAVIKEILLEYYIHSIVKGSNDYRYAIDLYIAENGRWYEKNDAIYFDRDIDYEELKKRQIKLKEDLFGYYQKWREMPKDKKSAWKWAKFDKKHYEWKLSINK